MVGKRGAAAQSHDDTGTAQDQSGWTTGAPTASAAALSATTSAASVFALVFGLIALISALTGVLAPLAIPFGIIGLVLGIIGRKKGTQPQVAGKGVATAGLVLSIIALLLGLALAIGAVTVLVNPGLLEPVQQWFTNLVNQLPGR